MQRCETCPLCSKGDVTPYSRSDVTAYTRSYVTVYDILRLHVFALNVKFVVFLRTFFLRRFCVRSAEITVLFHFLISEHEV